MRKDEFFVLSWKIARAAGNPTRALQTHDNGLQRAPVISYEELSGDRVFVSVILHIITMYNNFGCSQPETNEILKSKHVAIVKWLTLHYFLTQV